MPRTLITPSEIENPLYEAQLEPGATGWEKGWRLNEAYLRSAGPVVTLGQPQWWNLARLAEEEGRPLPPELALLTREASFYLVMLACSFRPSRGSEIEWARFTAYLRPKTGQECPIAFDLYPREIYHEIKVNRKIGIGPSLKFSAFEGKVGEMITTIEFTKLQPVVIGHGVLESAPNWDYEKHKGRSLRGSHFGYVIVKRPRAAEAVRLTLDVVADVVTPRGLLSTRVIEKDRAHLTRVVCTD